jgi:hypothetical protein
VDASRDARAEDFGRAVMAQAPPSALIFTSTDRDTFALWYFRLALGGRPDVAVVAAPMLPYPWYRQNLREAFFGLAVPEESGGDWAAALQAANARPTCAARPDSPAVLACSP